MKKIEAWQAEDGKQFFTEVDCVNHEKWKLFSEWYRKDSFRFNGHISVDNLHDFIQNNAEDIRGFLPPVEAKPELDIEDLERRSWTVSGNDVVLINTVKDWLAGKLR